MRELQWYSSGINSLLKKVCHPQSINEKSFVHSQCDCGSGDVCSHNKSVGVVGTNVASRLGVWEHQFDAQSRDLRLSDLSTTTTIKNLHANSISIAMSSFDVNHVPDPNQQDLCRVCQNISFDRLIEEGTIEHDVFKDIHHKSSHCVLCKLIFQRVKKSIIDSSVPEADVNGYIAAVGPSKIALRFSMSAENNDWLHIDVGPPSLMIDGWLPFGQSNSLRLFCQPGKCFLGFSHFFYLCKGPRKPSMRTPTYCHGMGEKLN